MAFNPLISSKAFPICDTDIWVDINLAGIIDEIFSKHSKILVADVVEKEILKFSSNPEFSFIATNFQTQKALGNIVVIYHKDIDSTDKILLERQLIDCDSRFVSGLEDNPHEKNKGEIVSAIYAEYYDIPFLKSNDGIFKEGNLGKIAFPDLIVKNRKETVCDLILDRQQRHECHQKIHDGRTMMNEGKNLYETVPLSEDELTDSISSLLKKFRGR